MVYVSGVWCLCVVCACVVCVCVWCVCFVCVCGRGDAGLFDNACGLYSYHSAVLQSTSHNRYPACDLFVVRMLTLRAW